MVIGMERPTGTPSRVASPARPPREHDVVKLDDATFEVRLGGRTVGFVWAAGPVWVAGVGERESTAFEVGQSLVFTAAVTAIERAVRGFAEAAST